MGIDTFSSPLSNPNSVGYYLGKWKGKINAIKT